MKGTRSKTSLRIAVVTETYPPEVNGVARTVHRGVQGILARGHQVDLFRPRQEGPELVVNGNLTQHLCTGIRMPFYREVQIGMPIYRRLKRTWKNNRPDIVHIITEGPLGLAALLVARKLKIPVISDYRTNYPQYAHHYRVAFIQNVADGYMRRFHNSTHLTLCPTREMRDDLAGRGYGPLEVVGRGVDTGFFTPARRSAELRKTWGITRDCRAVLYVGRIAAEKNIDLAVEAFRAMQEIDPKLKMILVGDGPQRARIEAANPDLIFAGMRRGQELAEYYASGDIFLFPSVTETFGNVITEAMASKLALVSYDYAAAREKLKDGVSAALAPLHDRQAFLEKARELAADRSLVSEYRTRAFAISRQCSWDNIIRKMEEIYLSYGKPRWGPTAVPGREQEEFARPVARMIKA